MKTLKVEVFKSDEAYYRWIKAREAGLRVSKYTPSIVVDDYSMMARIITKYKRLDTAIKHAKEAFADYPAIVEALTELESRRVEDKHITGISDRYSTINARYSIIGGGYSFLIVHRKASEQEGESIGDGETESGSKKVAERYQSKSGDTYSIITTRKDGKFFTAIDCGESGDKCGEWKIFDTYEEACRYLRSVGYSTLMKVIDVDESVGENERAETATEAETADETTAKAMVVEFCSNCETEIEMRWDVKTQGYKAYCPVCGEVLMLCSECVYRSGDFFDDCDFDGRDGTCRFNPKTNGGNTQDSNKAYCPVFGGWIMRYDACRGGCEYDSKSGTCKLYRNNTRKDGGA